MNITSKIIAGLALSFISLAACGGDDGGSGVDGNKQLGSLSSSERMDLCSAVVSAQGGAGTVHTCDGIEIATFTVAECVTEFETYTGCTATVAQAEACAAVDFCQSFSNANCVAVFGCAPE